MRRVDRTDLRAWAPCTRRREKNRSGERTGICLRSPWFSASACCFGCLGLCGRARLRIRKDNRLPALKLCKPQEQRVGVFPPPLREEQMDRDGKTPRGKRRLRWSRMRRCTPPSLWGMEIQPVTRPIFPLSPHPSKEQDPCWKLLPIPFRACLRSKRLEACRQEPEKAIQRLEASQ